MFDDLATFYDPDLQLPIRGKTYTVPGADAATGLRLQRIFTLASAYNAGQELTPDELAEIELSDRDEEAFLASTLSPALVKKMKADKVPWVHLRHAAMTAFIYHTQGRAAAEAAWNRPAEEMGKATTPEGK